MNFDTLKKNLTNSISDKYKIKDITLEKQFQDEHLMIIVDEKNKRIDLDGIVEVTNQIMDNLNDEDLGEYILEICSPGAEHEIEIEKLNLYIDQYVEITKEEESILGHIIKYENDILTLKVNLKGRMKNFEFKIEEIKTIKTRIKF